MDDIEAKVMLLDQTVEQLKKDVSEAQTDIKQIKEYNTDQKIMNERMNNKLDCILKTVDNINEGLCKRIDKVEKVQETLSEKGKWDWQDFVKKSIIPTLIILGIGAYIVSQFAK